MTRPPAASRWPPAGHSTFVPPPHVTSVTCPSVPPGHCCAGAPGGYSAWNSTFPYGFRNPGVRAGPVEESSGNFRPHPQTVHENRRDGRRGPDARRPPSAGPGCARAMGTAQVRRAAPGRRTGRHSRRHPDQEDVRPDGRPGRLLPHPHGPVPALVHRLGASRRGRAGLEGNGSNGPGPDHARNHDVRTAARPGREGARRLERRPQRPDVLLRHRGLQGGVREGTRPTSIRATRRPRQRPPTPCAAWR